jgi:hypothetical protein
MPPIVALTLTVTFIVLLLWRDSIQYPEKDNALWIPVIWLLINGSRPVAAWMAIFGLSDGGGESLEDGTPSDRIFFFGLLFLGLCVLKARKIDLAYLAANNPWIAAFLLYSVVSIAWSDFPFVALKRWLKVLTIPVMTLIVMTEPNLYRALVKVMKWASYIIIPVSILFIKYYPEWGKSYNEWTGEAMFGGVTLNKNTLGYMCLIFGYFYIWYLIDLLKGANVDKRVTEILLSIGFLVMIGWLFSIANSKTPMGALGVGLCVMLVLESRSVTEHFGKCVLVIIVVLGTLELTFGLYGRLIELMGRDPTLTDRTLVWHDVLNVDNNALVGTGFESFWLGKRRLMLWEKWHFGPTQAHNGYIEMYINLGWVGVIILAGMILNAYQTIRRELDCGMSIARFKMGLFFTILVYNYTEATFRGLHPVWFVFYLIGLDYPTESDPHAIMSDNGSEADSESTCEPVSAVLGMHGGAGSACPVASRVL